MSPSEGPAQAVLSVQGLQALFEALRSRGYRLIGPRVRDRAIVYDDLDSIEDLPRGWTDEQDGGRYRLVRRSHDALFGYAVGLDGDSAMCLAVPGRLLDVSGPTPETRVGRADFGGVVKEISLAFAPDASIGDYLLVHVGCAIAVIDETEAERVFEHLREIGELAELDGSEAAAP